MNWVQIFALGWIAGIVTAGLIERYIVPWGQRKWGGEPVRPSPVLQPLDRARILDSEQALILQMGFGKDVVNGLIDILHHSWNEGFEAGVKFAGGTVIDDRKSP